MPKASALTPPSPGDPDRKRVLNVLAQRRYRQRKREKYAALEKQAKSNSASAESGSSSSPDVISDSDQGATGSSSMDMSSGVSLLGFEDNFSYMEPPVASGADAELDLDAILAPSNPPTSTEVGPYTFGASLMPTMGPASYDDTFNPAPTFSMDGLLDMPTMKTMKVWGDVAAVLNSSQFIFDPNALWTVPFAHYEGIPANMQPTPAQLQIPHHPMFDILPWPVMRNRLIYMFAQPENRRPIAAQGPDAILKLALDADDETEGFRLNGEGVHASDWEIGQGFFKHWWWTLDRGVIDSCDQWRQKRGQPRLRAT